MADKKSQQEYNEVLKLTQSMLGEISRTMSDLSDESDQRNKKLSNELSITKQIVSSLESQEDIEKAIREIKSQKNTVSQTDFGVNSQLANVYMSQLDATEQILKTHQDTQNALEKVFTKTDEVGDKFKDVLNTGEEFLREIPLIGDMLGNAFQPLKDKSERIINISAHKFKKGFGDAFTSARASGSGFTTSFSKGLSSGMKSVAKFGRVAAGALGPIGIAVVAIVASLAIASKRFAEIETAAKNFRQQTGLLNSQTSQLKDDISTISVDMAGLGVSADDVSKAASDFTTEFDGIQQASTETLKSMVALNANFGVGTAEAAKLNKIFQNIGGLSETQAQSLVASTAEMAKMAGVAPQQVIKDIAENSKEAYTFFSGSPEALSKAAVQAAKLGTSIGEAADVARGLLDLESSLTSELEASALVGANFNFDRARTLAINNDIVGSQQAVLDEIEKQVDFNSLNLFQREAIAKASGMELGSLQNQLRIRQQFGPLADDQLEAANALLDAGKDLNDITKEDLALQTAQIQRQQGLQSETDRLKNSFGAIGTSLTNAFLPIVEFVVPAFADIGEILGDILVPTFNLLGQAIRLLAEPVGFLLSGFFDIVKVVSRLVSLMIKGLVEPFRALNDFLSSFYSNVEDFGRLIDERIIAPMESFFSSMRSGFIGNVLGFTQGGETEQVNDGVISPDGDIVSTNPSDFLIATQNPAGLAQNLVGNQSVSMQGVINKLDELQQAFLSNKDVFVDGTKVTASITRNQERNTDNRAGLQFA
jgi:hypothetical protein